MSINKIIIFLTSLFCSHIVLGQNSVREVEIKGIITDRQTGETLTGAYLFIKGTSTGIISDSKGQYVLHLNKGNYTLCGSFMGYQTKEVVLNANVSQTINIQLESGMHELDEVIISSRAKNDNITSVTMGVERMSIKEIQRLPALMGEVDVLKTIRLLPGVQATAEGGSGFSVRGGAPDQNLVLLDNTTVYNASHLLGFFSVFNNDVVNGFELYKGDLPLKYGGRLSSLLHVDTKSDMPEHFQGTGGIGIVSGRLMLEGKAGERTSWMAGGRRSFADVFFGLSPEETIQNASLYFYDLNVKISHQFSGKDHLEANGYYGKDLFGAEMGQFDYGNVVTSLLWKHSFSEKLFSTISLALSNYNYNVGAGIDEMQIHWGAGITDIAFKADFNQPVSNRWHLNYGISSILHRLSPGDISMSGFTDYNLQKVNALEQGVYLSNEQKLTGKISLKYGLRWSIFQNLGETTVYHYNTNYEVADSTYYKAGKIYHTYTCFEPRMGVLFLINDKSSVKANYAHNVQFMQLAENSASGSPLNVWFAASPNIKPQTVDLFSAGYFRNFLSDRYETSVEIYYKDLKNVIDFAEHADLLLNKHLEGDIRTGTGKAYGIEWSVKKNSGKLTGFLNYTLSRSERTISEVNEGKTYLAPYDKTHAVNIALSYELSKKLNVLATWVFATGTPTTYPAGRFEINGEYFPIFSRRNEYRKPDYHRLDLSVNFVPNPGSKKRWKSEWNFSVYNAYGRKNPWLISYSQTETSTPTATMTYIFQFVPSITYNFKF